MKDDESISLNNLVYVQTALQSLRSDIANVIDGLSNVNHSKGGDSNSAALNVTVFAGNTNSSLRRITVKKHFPYKIKKTNYGFDYLNIFSEQVTPAGGSLKNISASNFISVMNKVASKYYNITSGEGANALNTLYSYLPLYTKGVILPERLRSKSVDSNDWSALLQSMMLFKAEKLSPMSEKNIFSYTQQTQTNSKYFNRSLHGLGKKESASIFKTQKSKINELIKAERNQALVADFGLNIQDKIEVGEAVETINDKVTNRKMEVKTKRESSSTNIKTNYFLSYVNNFTEGNFNSNDLLPVQYADWQKADKAGEALPMHVISLIYHTMGVFEILPDMPGQPTKNYDFATFYNSLFDPNSGQLYASRLAEYFFTFLNFVKIDYLIDFEKFFMSSSTSDGPPIKTIVDVDNMALNSSIWAPLTQQRLLQMPSSRSLFCRITNHKMSFLSDHGLRKDLTFYPNFNKYFIINGDDANFSTVNDFTSQIISSGFFTG